jgi:hypothetical protein
MEGNLNIFIECVSMQRSHNLTLDWHTMMCARYFVPSKSTLSQMILDSSPYLRETFTIGMKNIYVFLYV